MTMQPIHRWSQRRLPLEFMNGLDYTTIIEPAEPLAGRRGSALGRQAAAHVMISWSTCKEDFRGDSSLRDIYITPATLADWRTVYSLLREQPGVEYSVDGVAQALPDSVEQALAIRVSSSPMLRFRVGRALVVFHFFSDEEIECDFYPNEIESQAELDVLLGFVRQLGDTTQKRVVITPENRSDEPFISYEPRSRDFTYHEVAA